MAQRVLANRARRRSPRGRWLTALLAGLGTASCVISPKPEPPEAEASLDIGATTIETQVLGDLDFRGGAGAAEPPGATVRATPLGGGPRHEATVAADGSFFLPGVAFAGEEVRIQVLTDTSRSAPVDLIMAATWGAPGLAPRALADCLILSPALELDLAVTQTVRVHSTCNQDVTLVAPVSLRGLPELELGAGQLWPATLTPGSELSFTITLTGSPSFSEEIVFVEATAPTPDRRPLTVRPP